MSALSVYLDADVLIAGAASPNAHSAAQVVLTLSEITLVDAITSTLAVTECRRNIEAKFKRAGEVRRRFDDLIARAVDVVEAPSPEQVRQHEPYAHWKDAPHLTAAAQHRCRYLVTYNVADYNVGAYNKEDREGRAEPLTGLDVIRPGSLVRTVRAQLAGL
jgi:predicted nucleic acid-binding protein